MTLQGIRDLQQEYQQRFGPNDYRPNLFVTYWSFRMMIGLMAIPVLFALIALWLTRGGQIPNQRWFSWLALLTMPARSGQQRRMGVHRDGAPALGRRP